MGKKWQEVWERKMSLTDLQNTNHDCDETCDLAAVKGTKWPPLQKWLWTGAACHRSGGE